MATVFLITEIIDCGPKMETLPTLGILWDPNGKTEYGLGI